MTYQLDDGNPDGSIWGNDATKKIAWYGATPLAQYAATLSQQTTHMGEIAQHVVPYTTGPHSYSSAAEEDIVVSTVASGACVYIARSSTTPGIAIAGYRVTSAAMVSVTLMNVSTAATVVPISTQAYQMVEFRSLGGFVTTAALTPAGVAASTTAEQTFTVPGAMPGMMVVVNKPTQQTALGIANARVSAASTVAIEFANISSASITPTAAETYTFALIPSTIRPASPIVQYEVPATTVAAACGISTTVEQTTTLMNLAATDIYVGNTLPTQQLGVFPVNGRINSSGVLGVTWANVSSASLTPTSSHTIGVTVLRPQLPPAVWVTTASFPATTIAATTTVEYTSTCNGLTTSSIVFVNRERAIPSTGIANVRVSAANTLTIALFNTATTLTAVGAVDYLVGATPRAPGFGIGGSAYQSSASNASTAAHVTYQVNVGSIDAAAQMRDALKLRGFLPG